MDRNAFPATAVPPMIEQRHLSASAFAFTLLFALQSELRIRPFLDPVTKLTSRFSSEYFEFRAEQRDRKD